MIPVPPVPYLSKVRYSTLKRSPGRPHHRMVVSIAIVSTEVAATVPGKRTVPSQAEVAMSFRSNEISLRQLSIFSSTTAGSGNAAARRLKRMQNTISVKTHPKDTILIHH